MGGARCAELDNLCTLVLPQMLFILRAESAIGLPASVKGPAALTLRSRPPSSRLAVARGRRSLNLVLAQGRRVSRSCLAPGVSAGPLPGRRRSRGRHAQEAPAQPRSPPGVPVT
jgi:hypothetical protein